VGKSFQHAELTLRTAAGSTQVSWPGIMRPDGDRLVSELAVASGRGGSMRVS
jgi:hypothetical protein